MNAQHTPTPFAFGPLSFAIRGDGPFIGQAKVRELVASLSVDELRLANREAWKQRRRAERQTRRYANVSVYGDRPHDAAFRIYDVAKSVCEATYAALAAAGEA